MIQDLREITYEAKQKGLCVIVWAYPRGSGISKQGETAIDVVAYAAHVCAQLGAHIIKIKPPSAHIEQPEAKQALESAGIPLAKLSDRVRYCVQAAFAGKRIVIFSGGAQKSTEDVIDEVREINAGGGFGSILGRNAFQRPRAEGIDLLRRVIGVYRSG
jgi:class I fructose-bisphosphate aldolase